MSSTSLRAVDLLIQGEPGALVAVSETPEGTLTFRIRMTDVINGAVDAPDIADLRGLFFTYRMRLCSPASPSLDRT
ncbi:hypothetical protein AA309_14935 [Microvirga vignae]|uniref:Uncharacterized protein n=1 Tax=Microvirga vignae TaxID=1225564 RepID=A0A0H1RI69_9HYPH|nr:hypothetical protein AA309_14935 [Microvirga vignae]